MKIPHLLNGNDLTLRVPMERHYMSNGSLVKAGITIRDITDANVYAVSENNAEIALQYVEYQEGVLVSVGGSATTCGYYGLKITGKYGERAVRSYIDRYFKLVHDEEEADTAPDGNGVYDMAQPMVIR